MSFNPLDTIKNVVNENYDLASKTDGSDSLSQTSNSDLNYEREKEMEKEMKNSSVSILENFINSDDDMKKITLGLGGENFNCFKPINTYFIFFWLIVLVFLIYLLFEYLYKKNYEKLI